MMDSAESIVISQKKLKLLSGGLGVALPTLVYLGNLYIYEDSVLKTSISSYYHTNMRDVFVGVLFAIGVFMIAYEGYSIGDRILSTIGGFAALGVALFPTTAPGEEVQLIGQIHLLFAAIFFLILGIFCFLFTKSSPEIPKTRLKKVRNIFYYISGFVLFASLVLLVFTETGLLEVGVENPGFWLEYVGISAFGQAWLIKGEGIFFLNDDPIFEMNPWEVLGFLILVLLVVGSFLMLTNIFVLV